MTDKTQEIPVAEHLAETNKELEQARAVVRDLANDLAAVADVIEPVLSDHVKRIRQARMASVEELRQMAHAVRELRDLLLAKDTERMLDQTERFLRLCRELEEFRAIGFLDAFVQAFAVRA
jgi:negative regulator of replication initiation